MSSNDDMPGMAGQSLVDRRERGLQLGRRASQALRVRQRGVGPGIRSCGRRPRDGSLRRYRSWHHELRRLCPGGRRAHRHTQRGRGAHHPVSRGVRQERRRAGRRSRQTPGRHERGPHRPLRQAPRGRPALALPRHRRRRGKAVHRAGDLRPRTAEAQARRRGLPRRRRHRRRRHRPRLLQRLPAHRHQGSRGDRRPEGAAHRQRTDRRGPRVRAGQGE